MYIHRWNTNKQAAEVAAFFIGPWPTVLGTVLYLDQQGLQALIPSTLCPLALSVLSLILIFFPHGGGGGGWARLLPLVYV